MNKPSFLLCLNGSRQSQLAAELAFEMAKKSNACITAQHVVDTSTSWDLLRNDEPGFVGSGMYVETFELLKNALWGIACKLIEKYDAVAESRSVDSTSVIDEGGPVEQICKRAKDHDLVIAGHQFASMRNMVQQPFHHVKYTVAEGLANKCPKPLLIVQKSGLSQWRDIKILVSLEHLNVSFIRACLRTSVFFGVTPKIICLMSGYHEEKAQALIKDMHKSHPDLANVEIETKVVRKANEVDQEHIELWSQEPIELELDLAQFEKSLLILPTREVSGKRVSILGVDANEIVAQLAIPAILLWPEESICSQNVEERDFEKLTAK